MMATGFSRGYTSLMSVSVRSPELKLSSPWWYRIFVPLSGAFASCVLADPFWETCFRESRRPIQEWMIAHGLGTYVGLYGMFHLGMKDMILAVVGGLVVGWIGRARWLWFALLFAVGYFVAPYVELSVNEFFHGSVSYPFKMTTRIRIQVALWYVLDIFPFAIAGAWLGSNPRKRRRDARRAAGLCAACGYNLRGNLSGYCPECGAVVPA